MLGHETPEKITPALTLSLRRSVTAGRARRETVRPSVEPMVRTLLERHRHPPEPQDESTETVSRQAESLSADRGLLDCRIGPWESPNQSCIYRPISLSIQKLR